MNALLTTLLGLQMIGLLSVTIPRFRPSSIRDSKQITPCTAGIASVLCMAVLCGPPHHKNYAKTKVIGQESLRQSLMLCWRRHLLLP